MVSYRSSTNCVWALRALISRSMCLVLLSALQLLSTSFASDPPAPHGLRPDPVAVVHLLPIGEAPRVGVKVFLQPGRAATEGRLLLRILDPKDQPIVWRYVEYSTRHQSNLSKIDDQILLRPPVGISSNRRLILEADIQMKIPGEYQVYLVASEIDITMDVDTDTPVYWGVGSGNGPLHAWDNSIGSHFVHPHALASSRQVSGIGISVGTPHSALPSPAQTVRDPVVHESGHKEIMTLVANTADWSLDASSVPLVLCPSKRAALAIKGSQYVASDGERYAHYFQSELDASIESVLEMAVASAQQQKQRSRRAYPARIDFIEDLLTKQVIDSKDAASGSLLRRDEGSAASLSSDARRRTSADDFAPFLMALAASVDREDNPYYGRSDLFFRAAAAALRDLSALEQDDTWPGVADGNPYPGFMAFPSARRTFPVYALTAPKLPPEIRQVWTTGLRRIIDRHISERIVNAGNQSAHYLLSIESFAVGAEDRLYDEMADLYFERWKSSQDEAGYFPEEGGADASYAGITHWMIAMAYRIADRGALLDLLSRSYNFFNHTVAPQPDGKLLGGFSFNTRVGTGFEAEQYQGARGILDDTLPEVSLWMRPPRRKGEGNNLRTSRNPELAIPRWLFGAKSPVTPAILPSVQEGSFIRQLGGSLVAVKRGTYYAYLTTSSLRTWPADRKRREAIRQSAKLNTSRAVVMVPDTKKVAAFSGGGLAGFWVDGFGHAILGANWAPTTHHGLLANERTGRIVWEDFEINSASIDRKAWRILLKGNMESHCFKYQRSYEFHERYASVELELSDFSGNCSTPSVAENLPVLVSYPGARALNYEIRHYDGGGKSVSVLHLSGSHGRGVKFESSDGVFVDVRQTYKSLGHSPIELHVFQLKPLGTVATADSLKLGYRIIPDGAGS